MKATHLVQGTPEWLEWRRGGYGSSDITTLVDGDEKAWVRLQLTKLGVLPDPEATEPMRWGKALEDTIARAYAEKTGEPVQAGRLALVHPELDHVRASLDRRRRRGRVIVELKAWSWPSSDFGPDGSDIVPMSMIYQVHQQMACAGFDRADVAVFFGGSKKLNVYRIGRDDGLVDEIVSLETAAWAYLQRGEVPAWPGPPPERPQLKADEIAADDELLDLVVAHELASADAEQAEAAVKTVKNQIRTRLDDFGGTRGELPDGRRFSVSHRPNRDSTVVDWEHLYLGARKRLRELGVAEDEIEFAVTALTTTHPGARPLRVTISQPKEAKSAA